MESDIVKRQQQLHVTLRGQFTFPNNARFKDILTQAADPDVKAIVFNLEKVDAIDSAALGMLMHLHSATRLREVDITLLGAHGQVDKVLRISKFDELFTMVA